MKDTVIKVSQKWKSLLLKCVDHASAPRNSNDPCGYDDFVRAYRSSPGIVNLQIAYFGTVGVKAKTVRKVALTAKMTRSEATTLRDALDEAIRELG